VYSERAMIMSIASVSRDMRIDPDEMRVEEEGKAARRRREKLMSGCLSSYCVVIMLLL
jgi:hypothetical protein